MKTIREIRATLAHRDMRSKWARGINEYAFELLDNLEDSGYPEAETRDELERQLLNGAEDWNQYSEGGSSLIWDDDIVERTQTPANIKKYRTGNVDKDWTAVQANALSVAARLILDAAF